MQRALIVPRHKADAPLRIGYRTSWRGDLYHHLLVLRWPWFLGLGMVLYLGLNVVFAALYLLDPGGIGKARHGSFADAFFFSIQTMATIGYGVLTPDDTYTNLLVTLETLFALMVLALATGLTFARFSRPKTIVTFSKLCTVAVHTASRRWPSGCRTGGATKSWKPTSR
jgi:inward rectifier potassium channel